MVGIPHEPERKCGPNRVQKLGEGCFSGWNVGGRLDDTYNQVHPEIQEIRGIKVGTSSEPFGTKIHPPMQSPLRAFSRHMNQERTLPSVQFSST